MSHLAAGGKRMCGWIHLSSPCYFDLCRQLGSGKMCDSESFKHVFLLSIPTTWNGVTSAKLCCDAADGICWQMFCVTARTRIFWSRRCLNTRMHSLPCLISVRRVLPPSSFHYMPCSNPLLLRYLFILKNASLKYNVPFPDKMFYGWCFPVILVRYIMQMPLASVETESGHFSLAAFPSVLSRGCFITDNGWLISRRCGRLI